MRSEKEMYDLILGYANADENIRAVILNGSRANPNRKPDPFNDFDIVYLVRDLTPCKEKAYYKDFGEILVFERTDESELFKEHFPEFVCSDAVCGRQPHRPDRIEHRPLGSILL